MFPSFFPRQSQILGNSKKLSFFCIPHLIYFCYLPLVVIMSVCSVILFFVFFFLLHPREKHAALARKAVLAILIIKIWINNQCWLLYVVELIQKIHYFNFVTFLQLRWSHLFAMHFPHKHPPITISIVAIFFQFASPYGRVDHCHCSHWSDASKTDLHTTGLVHVRESDVWATESHYDRPIGRGFGLSL